MRVVQIADLKNRLSAYLNLVRAGQEILIRDRSLPIAKIVPLGGEDAELDEQSLVAEGVLRLPQRTLDHARFWAIGRRMKTAPGTAAAMRRALDLERGDRNDGLLGRKRRVASVRSRPGK